VILLDTHTFLWWTDNAKELPVTARRAIERERLKGEIAISAISVWEVGKLVAKDRLKLRVDIDTWLDDVIAIPFLRVIPIDAFIAKTSVFLPNWSHKDPADRFIVATALRFGVSLVTGDSTIRAYKQVRTIW